jgi:hypothetical protein
MRIPVPPEMPRSYRHRYMANWWAVLTKRQVPYPEFTGSCVGCGISGVIGKALIHRGITRPTNLLCDPCNREDDIDGPEPKAGAKRSKARLQG